MDENKLTVNLNGNNIIIEVIDILENNVNGKNYIIYNIEGNDDMFYASILEEDENSYTLKEIKNVEEGKMIENYLENLNNENGEL